MALRDGGAPLFAVPLDRGSVRDLAAVACSRGITTEILAATLLGVIAHDQLTDAVLDDAGGGGTGHHDPAQPKGAKP